MNSKKIAWILANRKKSPVCCRKMMAVIPNLSWSFLNYEADLIAISKQGYLREVEIKITLSDLRNDANKQKFINPHSGAFKDRSKWIKQFYYAIPRTLLDKANRIQLYGSAGLITIDDNECVEIIREAKINTAANKLSLIQAHKLMRLSSLKYWGRQLKESSEEGEK